MKSRRRGGIHPILPIATGCMLVVDVRLCTHRRGATSCILALLFLFSMDAGCTVDAGRGSKLHVSRALASSTNGISVTSRPSPCSR